jgi:hypothetical protein
MKRLLYSLILALGLVFAVLALAQSPSLAQGAFHKVYITSVTSNKIVVSWTTADPCTATVKYGLSAGSLTSTANDTVNTTSHFVTLGPPLDVSTPYYFRVYAGPTEETDGILYSQATGSSFSSSPTVLITGTVYYPDAITLAPNVIVYLQVGHNGVNSQLVAVRTNATGVWNYQLANFRTADNNSAFTMVTGDPITITAQGGSYGTGSLPGATVPAAGPFGMGNIILNNIPNAITLRSLTSSAESSVWVPVGLALLGTAAIVVVVARKRRA